MAETIYINSESQSNKFWSYEVTGTDVHVKWGRIGGSSDEQLKSFGTSYEMQKFVDKKVREKEKKGYKRETKEKLKKETKTARRLGYRRKVARILWVSRDDLTLEEISGYDPKQFVYVEILDSWDKKMTRLVLSKEDTWMVGDGIAEQGQTIRCSKLTKLGYSSLAADVRAILKEMAEIVHDALKGIVKFGAMGVRNLFGDDQAPTQEVSTALKTIDTSGFDSSVVSTFAAMGMRTLDL